MSDNVPIHQQRQEMAGSGARAQPADTTMSDSQALVPFNPTAAGTRGKGKKRQKTGSNPAAPDGAQQDETSDDGADAEVDVGAAAAALEDAMEDSATLRTYMPTLVKFMQSLQSTLDTIKTANESLANQMKDMEAKHEQELMAMRDTQFQLMEQMRAQRRQAIETSVVLMPVPPKPGTTGPDLTKLGQLDTKKIAAYLSTPTFKVTDAHIRRCTKYAVRTGDGPATQLRDGQPCARIEVFFADIKTKFKVMDSKHRRALKDKVCAPLGYTLRVRDNLLVEELKEKRQLNAAAMSHLIKAEEGKAEADRTWYGWRRNRITWRVSKPGGGEAWALLSHLDVPEGSTAEQVKRAKELAEARALSAARAGPASRTERGEGRSTQAARGAGTPGAGAAAGPSNA